MERKRKILVTSALPYANGDIHLGHLVEYLQTDFWVRFQKMRGHECRYMCADDTHGTPVMISSRNQGITPEELIGRFHKRHLADFTDFRIEFDNYYTTNSPENRELSEGIYHKMVEGGHIEERAIRQLYCDHDTMFLPDRFVRGTCPSCGAPDQYGDSCDSCSATYNPSELKEPRCVICGSTPVERESAHVFFKLNNFRDFLKEWVPGHTSKEIANKLDEWLKEDLRDWDISRDAPYFGFQIPGMKDKYFYVWLDAPVGYISSTRNWCDRNGRDYREFWQGDGAELYHFIGKDIVYFHTLFWPAMLSLAGYRTPDQVFVHGFLTVNGEKMSKSKGTFIKARTYLDYLDPVYLRYYYACKLGSSVEDVDLSMEDFVNRVNAELIGKITNLASRSVQMLVKIGLTTGELSGDGLALVKRIQDKAEKIAELYEGRNFNRAMMEIRTLSEEANKYVDDNEPWKVIGQDREKARGILTAVINSFRVLAIYLKPVLPIYAAKVEELLNDGPFTWDSAQQVLENHEVRPYTHLAQRVPREAVEAIISSSMETDTSGKEKKMEEQKTGIAEIEYDDFAKVDLRVARIIAAEDIEGADKLLKLRISLGAEERTIFAGIKKQYKPEDLAGRHIIVVANLKPRKMKFGVSEGMLLAATGDGGVFLLGPDSGAQAGNKVS
jgi:methionyl-tRNA synthetase